MSERRACRVIDADRKSVRYRSTRDDDVDLREKLRELANQRRRFGYRRLHILLRREGIMINRKKTQTQLEQCFWKRHFCSMTCTHRRECYHYIFGFG